jgi:hypothetical protein
MRTDHSTELWLFPVFSVASLANVISAASPRLAFWPATPVWVSKCDQVGPSAAQVSALGRCDRGDVIFERGEGIPLMSVSSIRQ